VGGAASPPHTAMSRTFPECRATRPTTASLRTHHTNTHALSDDENMYLEDGRGQRMWDGWGMGWVEHVRRYGA
jgi:hypothetical protein